MGGRGRDQFIDTLQATTVGIVVTRHTRNVEDVRWFRSSSLTSLDIEYIASTARQQLLNPDLRLSDTVRSMIPTGDEAAPEVELDE